MRIPHVNRQKKRMNRSSARYIGLKALVGAAFRLMIVAVMLATHGNAHAQAAPKGRGASWAPGEYISAGGWGVLTIKPAERDGKVPFTIESLGANGHSCEVKGSISGLVATAKTDEDDKPCRIGFAGKANGTIAVDVKTLEACRYFCGARASFDADYLVPAAGCTTRAIKQSRDAFLVAYRGKGYARAEGILAPLLTRCANTLHMFEENEMINDLAVTLYRQGKIADCRRVLEPLMELASTPDDDIAAPPSDAETLRGHARAARTNLKLCGVQLKPLPKGKS